MNIEIANRLVELRRAHGLSQEELAARLGVSRQAVSKWERAESSPDTDNLIALAQLYGVTLDGLLFHEVETPSPAGGAAYAAAPAPEPEPEAEYGQEPDDEADIFATAAAWDAADRAASERSRGKLRKVLLGLPVPILLTIAFLLLGFTFGLWHPGWMLFLLVPVYYWIVGLI